MTSAPSAAPARLSANARTWLLVAAAAGGLLYLLGDILAPFLAGMLVAYSLDPLADRLERLGWSRTLATSAISVAFFAALVGLFVIFVPLLQGQLLALAENIPDYVARLRGLVAPLMESLQQRLTPAAFAELKEAAGNYAGDALKWLATALEKLLGGGMALFNLLSLLVIVPVVSFYLLRDYDHIVARVDALVPRDVAPTVRTLAARCDRSIAGFIRGQGTACLLLAGFYGLGLTAVGLEGGLVVGLFAGLVSFIPYFGAIAGSVLSLLLGVVQAPGDWLLLGLVATVFGLGQAFEGLYLQPKLIGNSIGVHPVWILFALLAGGSLFGFAGVLLGMPVAAVCVVLMRHFTALYAQSDFYRGRDAQAGNPEE